MKKILSDSNKIDNCIKNLIMVQLIIFPLLDMIRTTNFRHVELLGISLIELINIVLIGFSFLLTIIKYFKTRKIHIFGIFTLIFIYIVYILIHYKHIITFDMSIFPRASFSLTTEAFYILRVYLLPLLLLFILIENRDIFDKKFYFKILKIVIGIISFSIVFLDLFKISYISYSANHDFVSYNFIDYFLYSGDYKLISGRGWFDSANELSAIMLMLFPLNIYMCYKENKRFNYVLFAFQFLAMIILGTRTAAFGSAMIFALSIFVYIFLVFLKKEKINKKFVTNYFIIGITLTAYMTISPFMFGRINDSSYDFSVKDQEAYDELSNLEELDDDELDEVMIKYRDEYLINEAFLKMYPFSCDREFWIMVARRDKAINNNSRVMKKDIIARIKERNNNNIDTFLGMGYTLNFMDMERDYVYQYYLFGIVGLLLFISPYFIFLAYLIFKILFNFTNNFNYATYFAMISPMLGLVIAYLSGHVFGWVSPMMWLSVSVAILYCNVYLNEKKVK